MFTLASLDLCRQHYGDEQLIGIGGFELGRRRRVRFGEQAEEFENLRPGSQRADHVSHRIRVRRASRRGTAPRRALRSRRYIRLSARYNELEPLALAGENDDVIAGDRASRATRRNQWFPARAHVGARRCGRTGSIPGASSRAPSPPTVRASAPCPTAHRPCFRWCIFKNLDVPIQTPARPPPARRGREAG